MINSKISINCSAVGMAVAIYNVTKKRQLQAMNRQAVVNYLNEKNWALLDIEYIQTTKSHQCVRKLYILTNDGFTDLKLECHPCLQFKRLNMCYKKAFWHCQAYIHQLPYYPNGPSSPCSTAAVKLQNFITNNNIDLILYKGGQVEENICRKLGVDSFDIEYFDKDLENAYSHDPYVEVNCYYTQLVESIL